MLYYRAINDKNEQAIINNHPITAFAAVDWNDKQAMVNKISQHIKDGSNCKYSGCWISACKVFSICASEFSIPQSGRYNTSTKRKKIAVIEGKDYKGNLTSLRGKDGKKRLR